MRYLLTLLVGLIIGGAATVFFLGGFRSGASTPGVPLRPPDGNASAPGTIVVEFNQGFFDQLLGTLFNDLEAPAFQLSSNSKDLISVERILFQQCPNTIRLEQEGSSVKTQVQFSQGKIAVPLAFNGRYNLLGNCLDFKGWAQTAFELSFDQGAQTIYGRLNVEGVNLEGVNPVANNFVTVFVRTAIDERVNPLELLRGQQLQLMIPVKASNGAVRATVRDVRSEVLENTLKLHITYEFSGTRGQSETG